MKKREKKAYVKEQPKERTQPNLSTAGRWLETAEGLNE
jgi:hypothetical protein